MAEGNKTFEGLAVPLLGESEIQQQTAATDILTLTGAASQTGDFLVLQNSTGADAVEISVTSTGAIADGAKTSNAVLVSASSKSTLNAIIGYNSGGGSEVGSAVAI